MRHFHQAATASAAGGAAPAIYLARTSPAFSHPGDAELLNRALALLGPANRARVLRKVRDEDRHSSAAAGVLAVHAAAAAAAGAAGTAADALSFPASAFAWVREAEFSKPRVVFARPVGAASGSAAAGGEGEGEGPPPPSLSDAGTAAGITFEPRAEVAPVSAAHDGDLVACAVRSCVLDAEPSSSSPSPLSSSSSAASSLAGAGVGVDVLSLERALAAVGAAAAVEGTGTAGVRVDGGSGGKPAAAAATVTIRGVARKLLPHAVPLLEAEADPSRRALLFCVHWTLLEAVAKARGASLYSAQAAHDAAGARTRLFIPAVGAGVPLIADAPPAPPPPPPCFSVDLRRLLGSLPGPSSSSSAPPAPAPAAAAAALAASAVPMDPPPRVIAEHVGDGWRASSVELPWCTATVPVVGKAAKAAAAADTGAPPPTLMVATVAWLVDGGQGRDCV
jgi:hypothetical protein